MQTVIAKMRYAQSREQDVVQKNKVRSVYVCVCVCLLVHECACSILPFRVSCTCGFVIVYIYVSVFLQALSHMLHHERHGPRGEKFWEFIFRI